MGRLGNSTPLSEEDAVRSRSEQGQAVLRRELRAGVSSDGLYAALPNGETAAVHLLSRATVLLAVPALVAGCPSPPAPSIAAQPTATVSSIEPSASSAEPDDDDPFREPVAIAVHRQLIEKSGDPEIHVTYPVFDAKDHKLQGKLDAISTALRAMLDRDVEEMEKYVSERDSPGMGMPYSLSTSCEPTLIASWMVSIECATQTYSGGAHGNYGTTTHNYLLSLPTIKPLDVAGFFDGAQLDALVARVRADLHQQGASDIVSDQVDQTRLRGLLESFAVTSVGVVFHFSPYAVASYAEGSFQVSIPYAELSNFIAAPLRDRMNQVARGSLGVNVVIDPPAP